MPRTFNRRPLQVNVPNKNDVKNYFLNQVNWKGMIQNKNFLAVDQESFEDVSNIYVDNYNVLKSRPSVKRVDLKNNTINNLDTDYVHYFDELTIYHCGETLYVVKDDVVVNTLVVGNLSQYKLLQVKDFVIIFSTLGIMGLKADGTKYVPDVYVPKTKLVSVDGKESNLESKNIFTDKEITVYLYSSDAFNIKTDLLDKRVDVKIKDRTFTFTFDENISYRLFTDVFRLPTNTILTKKVKASSVMTSINYLPITISSKNTIAYFDKNTKSIYYSVDGKIFKNVLTLSDDYLFDDDYCNNVEVRFCRNNPAILTLLLKDASYIGASLYMLSVEPDMVDGSLRYPNLTLIKRISGLPNQFGNYDALDYNHFAYTNPVGGFDIFVLTPEKEAYDTKLISNVTGTSVNFSNYYSAFIRLTNNFVFCNIGYYSTGDWGSYMAKYDLSDNTYIKADALNNAYDFDVFGNSAVAYSLIGYETITMDTDIVSKNHAYEPYVKNGYLYQYDGLYDLTGSINKGSLINQGLNFVNNSANHSSYVYSYSLNFYNAQDFIVTVKSTKTFDVLEFEVINDVEDDYNSIVPAHLNTLDNLFISDGKNLYISQNTEDDSIYFPEINKHTFLSNITNLHPLSEREMGVFLDDEIWYTYTSDSSRFYVKSRLDFGCKEGNDVITSFDGKYTLFDTERGFAALAYQDFVASTEQSVTFISDAIKPLYNEFRRKTVKLTKYEDYLFLYDGVDSILVYDFRSNSWWPWTITSLSTIINDKELILIKNGKVCHFDFTSIKYYDFVFNKEEIDWTIMSQKLHLNANNNYKHIVNITFSAIENDDAKTLLSINLKVKNYRHFVDDGKEEVFDYRVQLIRTFVKRLNYSKVREFQYTLSMDKENTIKLPLSLSAISIKYKVGGQVR